MTLLSLRWHLLTPFRYGLQTFFFLLFAFAVSSTVLSTSVAQQVADLRLAPTSNDRVKLLTDDSDVTFLFSSTKNYLLY